MSHTQVYSYTTLDARILGVWDLSEKFSDNFVEVKIGKISFLRSLKNKLKILFLNSWDGDPINGTFKIRLKLIPLLSLVH